MLEQSLAEKIFKLDWFGLLVIAMTAQGLFKGKVQRQGGLWETFLVVLPYLIVFGCFSSRNIIGVFKPIFLLQTIGLILMLSGTIGYVVSIAHLRKNWTVSAAIKEGHTLVQGGPYKIVRHPMYFFMLLVVLGSGLLVSDFLIILYTPVVAYLYYLRSKKEEAMLIEALPGYRHYIQQTKMLIPGIF